MAILRAVVYPMAVASEAKRGGLSPVSGHSQRVLLGPRVKVFHECWRLRGTVRIGGDSRTSASDMHRASREVGEWYSQIWLWTTGISRGNRM